MIRNINILAILISILFFSSCGPASEGKNTAVGQVRDTTAIVTKATISDLGIDTSLYVAAVEKYMDSLGKNLSGLSLSKVDVFGESAEGGEISIYSSHSDTLRLKAIYYGEAGKNEYDLYFRGRQLIAFKETASYYNSPIGKRPVKIDSTLTASFILHNGKVVVGKKGRMLVDRVTYSQKSSEINDVYGEIRMQLKE